MRPGSDEEPQRLPLTLVPDRIRIAPESATAKGVEVSLRRADDRPLTWWLSYTWSSTKDKFPGTEARRAWDQSHFVAAGIGRRTDRWELSLVGSYHTGWPTTSIELVETEPIPLVGTGPRNGNRLDYYASIDARLARKFEFEHAGSLTLFLEVTNVLDRANDCCVEYDVEDEEETGGELALTTDTIESVPLVPSLGFVWQF